MADEIIGLEVSGNVYTYAYYIPIPTKLEIGGAGTTGEYPVPTPSAEAPEFALLVMSQVERDSLDSGDAALLVQSLTADEGASNSEMLVWAQQQYAVVASAFLADYDQRYKFSGRRFSKE